FFSSRRRHTRLVSDWSSDVCSSDLVDEAVFLTEVRPIGVGRPIEQRPEVALQERPFERVLHEPFPLLVQELVQVGERFPAGRTEIGRASCRERAEMWVVGGSVTERT